MSKKKKLIVIILTSLIAVTVIFAAVLMFLPKEIPIGFYIYCDDKAVFDYSGKVFNKIELQKDKTYTIKLQNTTAAEIELSLDLIDSVTSTDDITALLSKEGKTFETDEEFSFEITAVQDTILDMSLIFSLKGDRFCLTADPFKFKDFLLFTDEPEIILLDCIEITEDLIINHPCTLDTVDHTLTVFGTFALQTQEDGEFEIKSLNDECIISNDFYINAVKCKVTIEKPFGILKNENYNFYVDAKKFNGESLENEMITVKTEEEFIRLLDDTVFPFIKNGLDITLDGEFKISSKENEESVTFAVPVYLTIKEKVSLADDTRITFDTNENGKIKINSQNNPTFDDRIFFNTPNCDVEWENDALSFSDVENFMNVYSFNGIETDKRMGGEGIQSITSFSVNESTLNFSITGNLILAYIDFDTNQSTLSSLKVEATASNGRVEFYPEYLNSDNTVDLSSAAYCYVTDENGNKHSYKVVIERFANNLPILNIYIEDGKEVLVREEYLNATATFSNISEEYEPIKNAAMQIRGHGNSTWKWEKKPYRIKFSKKTDVLNMGAAKDWVLLANYADKSLIRNCLASAIAKKLTNLNFVSETYLVDLFVNGKYQGVYTICERIEVDENRVNIYESKKEANTGFLLEIGGVDTSIHTKDKDYFHTTNLRWVLIKGPDSDKITAAQFNYIKNYCTKADKAVMALQGYDEYIDIPSLIDWFILHELSYNIDSSFRRSCYLTKDKDGKLMMGPAWDFDLAFGNYVQNDKVKYSSWASMGSDEEKAYVKINWMNYLLTDPNFTLKLKARWNEVKDEILSTAYTEIDRLAELVEPSQQANFKLWNILGKKATFEPNDVLKAKTYSAQIAYLKEFIQKRSEWMDKTINEFK